VGSESPQCKSDAGTRADRKPAPEPIALCFNARWEYTPLQRKIARRFPVPLSSWPLPWPVHVFVRRGHSPPPPSTFTLPQRAERNNQRKIHGIFFVKTTGLILCFSMRQFRLRRCRRVAPTKLSYRVADDAVARPEALPTTTSRCAPRPGVEGATMMSVKCAKWHSHSWPHCGASARSAREDVNEQGGSSRSRAVTRARSAPCAVRIIGGRDTRFLQTIGASLLAAPDTSVYSPPPPRSRNAVAADSGSPTGSAGAPFPAPVTRREWPRCKKCHSTEPIQGPPSKVEGGPILSTGWLCANRHPGGGAA